MKKYDRLLVELQRRLGYSMKKQSLLVEALTHQSHSSRPSYERLEFLGDSALNDLITVYLFSKYPNLKPSGLNSLRSANTSNEKFARTAARHDLYRFLRHESLNLNQMVDKFIVTVANEDSSAVAAVAVSFGGSSVKAPKVLADIVESIAGAVYVDSDYDQKVLMKVFMPLLQPIITMKAMGEPSQKKKTNQPIITMKALGKPSQKKETIQCA